jgi:ketosteroid isomerase-like protein
MTFRAHAACCLSVILPSLVFGQGPKVDLKAEEAAIRAMIAARDKGGPGSNPSTEDRIVWSGPDKRPWFGSKRGETFPGSTVGKRTNQKAVTKVERVEVAASGELAWVYMTAKNEFDVDGSNPPRHETFENATLMVLKKVGGQWKQAAGFARPLDRAFVPDTGTLVGTWKLNADRSREEPGKPWGHHTVRFYLNSENFIADEAQVEGRQEPVRLTCDNKASSGSPMRCETVSERFIRIRAVQPDGARLESNVEVSADGMTLFWTRTRSSADGKIAGYMTAVYDRVN